jgi:hypothetical protein
MRLALVLGALALVFAVGTGTATARCSTPFCGHYHGKLQTATDPVGNVSEGGPLGFVVNAKGVASITASGTWNCSRNGSDIAPEPFHFDHTFGHPARVGRHGKFELDKHVGDLHVSLYGRIKRGKFSGYFAIGFLNGTDGCGTATMPATAKK